MSSWAFAKRVFSESQLRCRGVATTTRLSKHLKTESPLGTLCPSHLYFSFLSSSSFFNRCFVMFASCCCYLYFGCGCFCGSLPWMQFHDLDRHDRNLRLLLVTARSAVLPEGCIKVSVGHVAFLMNSGHHWCFCEVYLDVALVCPSRRCHPTNKYIYGLPVYQNQWCGQTSSHTKQITQIIANLHASLKLQSRRQSFLPKNRRSMGNIFAADHH